MEKVLLWSECIHKQFIQISEQQLDMFLELLSYIEDYNISNLLDLELYENIDLWEWLESKEQISLRDIKRELSIKVSKAKKINKQEYVNLAGHVGKLNREKVMILEFSNSNIYYIATVDEYYDALRSYLAMEKKDDFCKDMVECFPNIYFDVGIAATVNSLNRDFDVIKMEIVEHLTKINEYHSKFVYLCLQNKSNQEISRKFSEDTGIECSPQSGRESIQGLKIVCYNQISKRSEIIKCELHTKFKKFNIDRTKQDRIYFFPGKPGIQEGKIIVKHIGKHL